ncbi:2,5-diamino-6-(ribosylamino)-4(3H)-pyrimidinone 5'-phosphate reductase [Methanoregula sp.]|uniref:2,5-diamino-6-(ribosylamino)-4(3H)-pyrimidinone 5'-phosphate reductase n=1 Tax=Methanoregula sp. TaxID=2052170 RepID=UPI002B5599B0|nr:2,5-diamino-6-(ribosylamino)-4(3H)-pyrimidinone 5'-phosphate reductase [Methanoregula sp.]HVP96359.1 2,5-diamino-6-(ribosylamino)-4(3H)-pyrimidinone 5'-phosphate reductase [Methanoregula sp.]
MRPSVVVNVAMSADGKLSTRERRQVKISGSNDFARVDRLKAGCDAVMVGIGTVLADDPSLTVKNPDLKAERQQGGRPEHPVRVVIDSGARIPPEAAILNKGDGLRVVAVAERADPARVATLREKATVITAGRDEVDLPRVLDELGHMGIRRLMVEGGGTLIAGLVRAGLVDEIYTYIGSIVISGKDAPTLADGEGWVRESDFARLTLADVTRVDDGVLLHWTVRR